MTETKSILWQWIMTVLLALTIATVYVNVTEPITGHYLSPCVITVGEFAHVDDIKPPCRLNLIMNNDGVLKRCNDYGGELIYYPWNNSYICEDADY